MDLAQHQRKLLGLFRSTYQVSQDDDPYIHQVAQSKDLEEGRRNIFLWRIWVLERTAVLTVNLLKRRNLLEQAVAGFMKQCNISPYRDTQTPAFLEVMSADPDPLIASVAQFELALIKVKQGDLRLYTIPWNCADPVAVLNALARDLPFDDDAPAAVCQILVSHGLPGHFQVLPDGALTVTSPASSVPSRPV
jgi:hypothetical protein